MSDKIAVEEKGINTLISELFAYYENISKYLESIDESALKISSSFEGEIRDAINTKFIEFQDQFPKLKAILESHIEDIKKLNVHFKDEQSSISTNEIESVKGGEFIDVKY